MNGLGEDTIKACPECDSPNILQNVAAGDSRARPSSDDYWCKQCRVYFDAPEVRPPKRKRSGAVGSDLADALIAANPDTEIRAKDGESP